MFIKSSLSLKTGKDVQEIKQKYKQTCKKKKHQKKKITITITERNQANLQVLILNVGYIGFTIMKQMGDNEAYPLNALSTCEEPLISAGEGGGSYQGLF